MKKFFPRNCNEQVTQLWPAIKKKWSILAAAKSWSTHINIFWKKIFELPGWFRLLNHCFLPVLQVRQNHKKTTISSLFFVTKLVKVNKLRLAQLSSRLQNWAGDVGRKKSSIPNWKLLFIASCKVASDNYEKTFGFWCLSFFKFFFISEGFDAYC